MLHDLEQRPDFGGAIVMPLPKPRRTRVDDVDAPDLAVRDEDGGRAVRSLSVTNPPQNLSERLLG